MNFQYGSRMWKAPEGRQADWARTTLVGLFSWMVFGKIAVNVLRGLRGS
jgi:hypothetical protein